MVGVRTLLLTRGAFSFGPLSGSGLFSGFFSGFSFHSLGLS